MEIPMEITCYEMPSEIYRIYIRYNEYVSIYI